MSDNKIDIKCNFTDNKMGLGGKQELEYVCQLPESDKKKALEELREDCNIREQSLNQIREWIEKHPNIKKCRTGQSQSKIQSGLSKLKIFFKIKVNVLQCEATNIQKRKLNFLKEYGSFSFVSTCVSH